MFDRLALLAGLACIALAIAFGITATVSGQGAWSPGQQRFVNCNSDSQCYGSCQDGECVPLSCATDDDCHLPSEVCRNQECTTLHKLNATEGEPCGFHAMCTGDDPRTFCNNVIRDDSRASSYWGKTDGHCTTDLSLLNTDLHASDYRVVSSMATLRGGIENPDAVAYYAMGEQPDFHYRFVTKDGQLYLNCMCMSKGAESMFGPVKFKTFAASTNIAKHEGLQGEKTSSPPCYNHFPHEGMTKSCGAVWGFDAMVMRRNNDSIAAVVTDDADENFVAFGAPLSNGDAMGPNDKEYMPGDVAGYKPKMHASQNDPTAVNHVLTIAINSNILDSYNPNLE